MRKKIIYLIISIIIILFLVLACSHKSAISSDKFTRITQRYHLKVINATKQFSSMEHIKNVSIAESEDYWQIEFYVFDSYRDALNMFRDNHKELKKYKNTNQLYSDYHSGRCSNITVISNQVYMHSSLINNTLLYVSAPVDYQKDVEKVLKALKY